MRGWVSISTLRSGMGVPQPSSTTFARTVWWGYGYAPTPAQYERACFVIRHAGAYGR